MTVDHHVTGTERALAVSVLVAMAGGVVVGLGDVASLPSGVVIVGAAAFFGGIALIGVITYRAAQSTGSSFGSALHGSLRTVGKVLVALMP
jgi:hypothetical protein